MIPFPRIQTHNKHPSSNPDPVQIKAPSQGLIETQHEAVAPLEENQKKAYNLTNISTRSSLLVLESLSEIPENQEIENFKIGKKSNCSLLSEETYDRIDCWLMEQEATIDSPCKGQEVYFEKKMQQLAVKKCEILNQEQPKGLGVANLCKNFTGNKLYQRRQKKNFKRSNT